MKKTYYEKHKDERKQYQLEYSRKHKHLHKSTMATCACGITVQKVGLTTHQKTFKHLFKIAEMQRLNSS